MLPNFQMNLQQPRVVEEVVNVQQPRVVEEVIYQPRQPQVVEEVIYQPRQPRVEEVVYQARPRVEEVVYQARPRVEEVIIEQPRVQEVFPPNVDMRLLSTRQPYVLNEGGFVDVDQQSAEFSNDVAQQSGMFWNKMQSFVGNAYTDMDLNSGFGQGRAKLNKIFIQAEQDRSVVATGLQSVVQQNGQLIAKSKALGQYNAKLSSALYAQRIEIQNVAALKEKLRQLQYEAERAGLVAEHEEESHAIGEHRETGKKVISEGLARGLGQQVAAMRFSDPVQVSSQAQFQNLGATKLQSSYQAPAAFSSTDFKQQSFGRGRTGEFGNEFRQDVVAEAPLGASEFTTRQTGFGATGVGGSFRDTNVAIPLGQDQVYRSSTF